MRVQRSAAVREKENRMSQRFAAFALVLFAIACTTAPSPHATLPSSPDPANGVIAGIVNFNGLPLPGVTLSARRDGDRQVRTTITDATGAYRFAQLPRGTYTIVAEMESLYRETRSVAVADAAVRRVDVAMRLSGISEMITVTASAPATLETSQAQSNASIAPPPPMMPDSRPFSMQGVIDSSGNAQYASVPEHSFVAADRQPLTTFALDVDRASYTNVRRYLAASQLPPPEAVRVEEMVNYFAYHDAEPSDGRPLAVTTEVAACPWNLEHRLLRIGVKAKTIARWKAAPNHLVFLIDVSGSMRPPDRLPLIKQAFRLLVEQLRTEDSVAIVTYAGAAGLALPPTSGADKSRILDALDHLESGGSTAGGEGIRLAYELAAQNLSRDANHRVILATDGDFNVGISDQAGLTKLIESERDRGIFLTVLGVGSSPADARMEALADHGNGIYAYLDSMQEAKKVFVRELTGTLVTVAKDVKVQLAFDPAHVESYRQIGYENRALANQDFSDDRKDAGDLGAGHTVTALYEIVLRRSGATGRLATLRVRYKEPASDRSVPFDTPVVDDGASIYRASTDLQFAAAVAEIGMLLSRSAHSGRASYDEAIALARAAHGDDLDGDRDELVRLAETSRNLSR
jgi:Ca-activated chloride channel family protein